MYVVKLLVRVASWSLEMESGVHMCASPRVRSADPTPAAQGDLYIDRSADRATSQPEPRREEPAYDDYDDRDHRKSGWSLFGRKRQAPTYPAPSRPTESRMTEMRPTMQTQPEPQAGEAEDDLEIPSFLRRLAN